MSNAEIVMLVIGCIAAVNTLLCNTLPQGSPAQLFFARCGLFLRSFDTISHAVLMRKAIVNKEKQHNRNADLLMMTIGLILVPACVFGMMFLPSCATPRNAIVKDVEALAGATCHLVDDLAGGNPEVEVVCTFLDSANQAETLRFKAKRQPVSIMRMRDAGAGKD